MRTPSHPPDPNEGQLVPRQPGGPATPRPPERDAYYGYGYDDAGDEGSSGLLEYWHILRRRKGTVILITFLGGLLALLLTLPQTPIYQARTTVEIQNMNPEFMGLGQVNPVNEGAIGRDNSDLQTQIEIMKSQTLVSRVLKKLEVERPEQVTAETSRPSSWRRALNLPEPEPEDAFQEALGIATQSLEVRATGQTRIVQVLVDSTDAQLATRFVNTLADEYIDLNLESRWDMTQRTGQWLSGQLDEMRIKLERSEEALQAYARKTGLVYTGEQGSVEEDRLRQLQQSLTAARTDRIGKESRYKLIQSSPPEALPDVLNDASLREYQTQLTGLRRQQAELATTFTPEHASRRRVEAQIAEVQAALEKERGAVIRRIQNEYEEAVRREALLDIDYRKQTALVSDESNRAIQYNILKREVDSNRQLYETMLERVKEASVASALRASNVRVVDPARVPSRPYKPNAFRNTLLGLLLGGFCAVVFVIIRERADRTLQEPGDVNFYVNLPELGVVPSAEHKKLLGMRYRRKETASRDGEAPDTEGAEADAEGVEMVVLKRKPSMVAESFRAALTSILFSGQNGSRPRVLTLTSAHPSEGKTTVASNLAIALAEVNQRVLLIDGDLRKPRMHEIFHLTREHGLSELLKDRSALGPDVLNGSIRETMVPNLYVLPSGESSAGSTNLLYSDRMSDLIELFEKEFDMVLVDSPPMLHIPDARILGRMSDAVILVIRAGQTTRDTALAARQRFAEDGTKVLGSILNYWEPKAGGGRYGYYNRYHYYKPYYQKD